MIETKDNFTNINELSPCLIREGLYGATFIKEGEPHFVRMELLTKETEKCWGQFKRISSWVANENNGVLSELVNRAGKESCPQYEEIAEVTGFTNEEYIKFIEKAIFIKNKTQNKIVNLLRNNTVGNQHMITSCGLGESRYIVYITKNSDFSIQHAHETFKEINLENFINAYSDILISVGSDFSKQDSFHTRGIARNPYWMFEDKYAGLAMIVYCFPGVVAEKFFPEKIEGHVKPVGVMQCNLIKNLLPGEGYVLHGDKEIDITTLSATNDDPESKMNYVKVSALARIYFKIVSELKG